MPLKTKRPGSHTGALLFSHQSLHQPTTPQHVTSLLFQIQYLLIRCFPFLLPFPAMSFLHQTRLIDSDPYHIASLQLYSMSPPVCSGLIRFLASWLDYDPFLLIYFQVPVALIEHYSFCRQLNYARLRLPALTFDSLLPPFLTVPSCYDSSPVHITTLHSPLFLYTCTPITGFPFRLRAILIPVRLSNRLSRDLLPFVAAMGRYHTVNQKTVKGQIAHNYKYSSHFAHSLRLDPGIRCERQYLRLRGAVLIPRPDVFMPWRLDDLRRQGQPGDAFG